jgi:hypothetical protein
MLKPDHILFDEAAHSYLHKDLGVYLPSVTTVINKLKKPFDKVYWAKVKAKEYNMTVEAVIEMWDKNRDDASGKGRYFHKYMEDRLNRLRLPFRIDAAEAYLLDYRDDMSIENEVIVGNNVLAGTFDNLSERNGYKILKDWKTNREFKVKSEYRLLPPFDYLDDSHFTIYSLQLSLYRYLLDIPIYKMEVVHFSDDGYTVYDVPYLEREARLIIKKLEDDNRATCSSTERSDTAAYGF